MLPPAVEILLGEFIMAVKSKLLYLAAVSLLSASVNAGSITLQAGAFKSEAEAKAKASEIEKKGFSPVSVRAEETAEKGLFYKVLVGDFGNRADASAINDELKSAGVRAFIRSSDSYDVASVAAAISGRSFKPYFHDSVTSTSDLFTTHVESLLVKRKEVLTGETTSPETLKRFADFVTRLPASTARSRDIVTLGHYTFSGKSAYNGKKYDLTAIRDLLLQVANGNTPADVKDCLAAREMVAHELHYYSRKYPEALSAYEQLLNYYRASGDVAKAAKARMELAATAFEFTKVSGLDKETLESRIADFWQAGIADQSAILTSNSAEAIQVRVYTCRIGLMLEEIIMLQKDWSRAGGGSLVT